MSHINKHMSTVFSQDRPTHVNQRPGPLHVSVSYIQLDIPKLCPEMLRENEESTTHFLAVPLIQPLGQKRKDD